MIAASTVAVLIGTLIAGAVTVRPTDKPLIVPAASSDAHRPDAYGNYGGLKRSHTLPSSRSPGARSISPFIPPRRYPDAGRQQPYPYQYYQDTRRGNEGCHWLARRAIDTNNLNWWTRYRSCTRNKTDFKRPSYSPPR